MSDTKYTDDHEWIMQKDQELTLGITEFAQSQLGDVVFVELPEIGTEFAVGDEVAVIESVKAAGEIHTPVAGTVTAVNEALVDDPELVNRDPAGEGWFMKLSLAPDQSLDQLMDEAAYQALIAD